MNVERIVKVVGISLQIYLFALILDTLIFLTRDILSGPTPFTVAYGVLPLVSLGVILRNQIYGRIRQKDYPLKDASGNVYLKEKELSVPIFYDSVISGEAETRKIGKNYVILVNTEKILDRLKNSHQSQTEYQDTYDSIIEHEKAHVELYKYFPRGVIDVIKWNSRVIAIEFIISLIVLLLFLGPYHTQERLTYLMILIHWAVIVFFGWFLFPLIEASVLVRFLELTCDLKAVKRVPRLKKLFIRMRHMELLGYSTFIKKERWRIVLITPWNFLSLHLRRFSLKSMIEFMKNGKVSLLFSVWFGLVVFHMFSSLLLWVLTDITDYPVVGGFFKIFFGEMRPYIHIGLALFLPALAIRFLVVEFKHRVVSSVVYLSFYNLMVIINHLIINWFRGGLVRVIEESLVSLDQFFLSLLSIQSRLAEIFLSLNHFYPVGTLLFAWILFLVISSTPLEKFKDLTYLFGSK